MHDLAQLSPSRFWTFSLSVYGDESVARACLGLQDGHGLDVNMLLFALFAGAQGTVLSRAEIEQLDHAVEPWRRNVVRPLRQVRRWLKAHGPAGDDRAGALRRNVLEREIESEAYQQGLMERTVAVGEGAPDSRAGADNLVAYVQVAGVAADDALLAGLATLLAGSFAPLAAADATALLAERWQRPRG
jgi:uncharacterized protein (TIGR02444 family)